MFRSLLIAALALATFVGGAAPTFANEANGNGKPATGKVVGGKKGKHGKHKHHKHRHKNKNAKN